MSYRARLLKVTAVFVCFVSGCSGSDDKAPRTATVTGKVTYKGSPVPGATVAFYNDSAPGAGIGMTDARGLYQIRTGALDGAVIGDHTITVTKIPAQAGDYNRIMGVGGEVPAPPRNELPEKYSDRKSSTLKFSVKSGNNEFPLDLTD